MQGGAGHAFNHSRRLGGETIWLSKEMAVQGARHVFMKTQSAVLIALALNLIGCSGGRRQEPLAACNNDCGFEVYGKLRGGSGNFVFSPRSVLTALGMIYAGAGGDTASEIARAARFPQTGGELHHRFRSSLRPLQNQSPAENYSL